MPVMDHLRELRRRLIVSVVIVAIGAVLGWYFYEQLLDFLKNPYCHVPAKYRYVNPADPKHCDLIYHGVLDGFTSRLKIAVIAGIVVTGPLWLYQIWAFITPGLLPNERRWSAIFVAVAGPLFLVGVAIGYVTLPTGVRILISFNHSGVKNLVEFNEYLSFFSHTLLMFGVAFEIPVFVYMLNRVGVLPARILPKIRPWVIVGIFVFAAAATPSTDPFTMSMMAIPMCVLYGVSEVLARIHDRRKQQTSPYADLDPDEPSPL